MDQHTPNTLTPPASDKELGKVMRLPGIQLEVRPGKEVIIRFPGVEQSYRGKIVGFSPYDFLIAKVRLPSKLRQQLALGGTIILKYVHKGTVYGFKSTVQNIISSPAPLVFFEYPDVIEKLALRRTSRIKCNIDCSLHTTDAETDCMLVNVSETGCRVSTRSDTRNPLRNTRVDDALILGMNLGNQGELRVAVAVKNVSTHKGIMALGCMFLDISKEEMNRIQQYLEKISRLTR